MSIYEKLFDWQKAVVNKFYNRDSFGLFLDCGLGKTPTALAFAEKHDCTRIIIITLKTKAIEKENVEGSWAAWLASADKKYTVFGKKCVSDNESENTAIITNYEALFERGNCDKRHVRVTLKETLKNYIKTCRGQNVALIIDESHKIKNLQSLQTLAITELKKQLCFVSQNVYTYLLTGTPFTTGYIDLYAQLKILGCKMTKAEFIDKFCERGNIRGLLGWQQPIVSYKNLDELFKLVHEFAITLDSNDVVHLPEQIFIKHSLDETNTFKALTNVQAYPKFIRSFAKSRGLDLEIPEEKKKINNPFYGNLAYPFEKWTADTVATFWLRARQASIGFQGNSETSEWFDTERLKKLNDFLLVNPSNYILFYNYTPELLAIYDICDKLNYNIDVYCGEIKSLIFYDKFCKMSNEKKLVTKNNIILANFASGATGMNWQEYNKCIIFSCPLFKDYKQGLKRINRIGQKNTTFYHLFYQNNWLDKKMLDALDKKVDYSQKMFAYDLKNNL